MAVLLTSGAAASPVVLVEAEQFADFGGWVLDQQFMDQMGSPYLLAHGLGVPVKDATARVDFPAAGAYHVWVRTRDWVAPWGAPGAPGRFQVLVDGKPLTAEFGTEGAEWHWQDGGEVTIGGTAAEVSLHDLTGFEGRCDAVLFASDPAFIPPNDLIELMEFRRQALGIPAAPENAGSFDLVVVGGGIAGTCAALSAARLGVRVALIQDRPVLGGNNSSEVRVWLGGKMNFEPYPRIGDVVHELDTTQPECPAPAALYEDDTKLQLVRNEPNITLFLDYRANVVEKRKNRIHAVMAQHTRTGRMLRFESRWFADCTGDGCIGFLAGADFEITETGHMGPSNLWNFEDTGAPSPFPRCPWAVDLSEKAFPEDPKKLGRWFWESGFDLHPVADMERIRDQNFRGMYGAWDALKNVKGQMPNYRLEWAAYIAGKRESRRLLGDVVLTKEDLLASRPFEDGCLPTSWSIDVHRADPKYIDGFGVDAFLSVADFTEYPRPYWVPYRCLYSRNIDNLFMAGRDISVTHEALGTVRVMRTTGMMGEVVGMAAAICKQKDTNPRGVYEKHLAELQNLMRQGASKADCAVAGAPK
jgi:hypothetical protein